MTNIVVLIKQVPDTWSERKLTEAEKTLAERRLEGHRLSDDPDGKDEA